MSTKKYAPSVTLTPAQAKTVNDYLNTLPEGNRYGKRSEVINEALEMWTTRIRNSQIIDEALADIDMGTDQRNWYDDFRRKLDSD